MYYHQEKCWYGILETRYIFCAQGVHGFMLNPFLLWTKNETQESLWTPDEQENEKTISPKMASCVVFAPLRQTDRQTDE